MADLPVNIDHLTIDASGYQVTAEISSEEVPENDDDTYYLFAQQPYESGIQGELIAKGKASEHTVITFPLFQNSIYSRLYHKFAVIIIHDGEIAQASSSRYIENPEILAMHTTERDDHGKKGILPSAAQMQEDHMEDLGIDQITYNVLMGDLCSDSGGSISYEYNGKTYYFSRSVIGQYDYIVPKMNAEGVQVTLILLNNRVTDETLIHPLSRDGVSNYYAFNTAERQALQRLQAAASFLAGRYSDSGHGTVDNWIIGNEVNARADWNYMQDVGVDGYAKGYADAVRMFYQAIRSQNANARIYISIDSQWTGTSEESGHYDARTFLDSFNTSMKAEGDIDWHVAVHPYNTPMKDPVVWAPKDSTGHNLNARFITMQNIDVLTDYLGQEDYLTAKGEARSVLASEVGFSSLFGEDIQAASVAYGYLQAEANQHVDGFILAREQDSTVEIRDSLALGLTTIDGREKKAYEFYRDIDDPEQSAGVTREMAEIMGVDDVMDLITRR